MNKLVELHKQLNNSAPSDIKALGASGSNRQYFRISGEDGRTTIGAVGTSVAENVAFVTLARHFKAKGMPVPEVYAVSSDNTSYVQEDIGSDILFDHIAQGRMTGEFSDEEMGLLKRTVALLPRLQYEGAEGLDFSVCYPQPEFDARMIAFDLNYFKYCFLKPSGLEFDEVLLENDFERMRDVLLGDDTHTFMYRDFQSRNVMIKDGEPYFIDFQGGRRGPVYYDVASFVWQAKANFPHGVRMELIDTYLDALQKYRRIGREDFLLRLRHFVLFRTLQVLGAYGFRGLVEQKAHFIQSIPFAINNLKELIEDSFAEYPYLMQVLEELVELPKFAMETPAKADGLLVTVSSFSYKKGIPMDLSGNGGGYVFDCRAIHNPGRYEPYKKITGMVAPVIEFLEKDGEILTYLESVYALVDAHVERYMERGFSSLMISFGCTGGQHRSVYCAEAVFKHIKEKYDVGLQLNHREQEVSVRVG